MANVGYTRVSSEHQKTERQLNGIKLDKTFTEKLSGKSTNNRQALWDCIDYIRDGDTLHLHSIDRLARNLADLQQLIARIIEKGVVVKFHAEGLIFSNDGNNPMNNLMMQVLGAFAEFERSMIRERQREGINKALSMGVKFGAAPKINAPQIEEIKSRRAGGESVISIADEFNVSRQTIYSILQK
jgi:DNA invertase Pin-like site-specific DNA recombinase